MEEKILGQLINFDPYTNRLVIQCDFITPDKLRSIQDQIKLNKPTAISFKKVYKNPKTNKQLKKYYKMINIILRKLGIYPDVDIIEAFDTSIKNSALPCESLVIYDREVPIPMSKADMSAEQLSILIEYLYEHYTQFFEDEEDTSVSI